jgi:transcription-repair coupling factor (superfamily II helicase)
MAAPPLRALGTAVLADPALRGVAEASGHDSLRLQGPPAARPAVVAALAAPGAAGAATLVVTATEREAAELAAELGELLGEDEIAHLPSWETLPHEKLSPRADTVGRRLAVLRRLAHPETAGPLRAVTATARSFIQPLAPGLGELEPVSLVLGEETDFEGCVTRLGELAYSHVDMVGSRGEYAVRGGIIDLFPPTETHPLRVEFFGDEVTDIRPFSVADQRSISDADSLGKLSAPPCRELLLSKEVRERAAALGAAHRADAALAELLDKLAAGIPSEGMEALIPVLCDGEMQLLTDLCAPGTHVLLADPEKVRARAADLVRTGAEFLEASWMAAATGGAAPVDLGASAYRSLDEATEHARRTGRPLWSLSQLTSDAPDAMTLDIAPAPAYRGETDAALRDLRAHVAAGGTAALVVPGAGTADRALEQLRDAEIPAARGEADEPLASGQVTVLRGGLESGFSLPGSAVVVLTEADLTGDRARSAGKDVRRMPSKRRNAVDPLALSPGDYVVHARHGIGRYIEMTQRTMKDGGGTRTTREYLVLEYAASKRGGPPDRLFVPTDQLDEVSRYVGGEQPTLNKLGGSDWQATKSKARRAVNEIAAELVQLYAARQSSPGHAFGPDTPWQRELEDAFCYVETPDQLAAADEVKDDMRRGIPMDRVISGDVGYGKTEIAVRAAFKAVQDGKQVALLVPTTLLAHQHLVTFTERMQAFPVTVKGLSRFTSAQETERVLIGLAEGSVDIVIGTHRLLQTGVRYHDLGLVIVDEEQRFGVEHKEHIKSLRTHVDVLTLSATPIPRTLEMSLAGIRDMSTISTPPEERHPILTYVGAYQEAQVAAAIRRELLRDGQVFYIHNRVSSIEKAATRLRELVPEARIVTAHGRMPEDRLERTVDDFWHDEFDVLVCTTIVESGLDIANANTLIAERGDTLGLAQMHQLRGRVGRGRERGYAYFLYPGETPLTETAHDRLATIAQNTELGAGMAVAMKDLEIRGAGNILGAEQSGHIAGVGFDLYIRLVGEAVEAFREHAGAGDAEDDELAEVRVDLPVDAHIPHDYAPGERLRLEAYRKIAAAGDDAALTSVADELTDRYGPLPVEVENLMAVASFKATCRAHGVSEVTAQGNTVRFAPLELRDSQQVRLKRLYPRAVYKPATTLVSVPKPTEGPAGGRIGAAPLRDRALLAWCTDLLEALDPVTAAATASA